MAAAHFDILGNEIRLEDLILVTGGNSGVFVAVADRLTEKRCYFEQTRYSRYGSGKVQAFRSYDQVLSLSALGLTEEDRRAARDGQFQDLCGTLLAIGAPVIGAFGGTLCRGTVTGFTKKLVCVTFETAPESARKYYSSQLLAYTAASGERPAAGKGCVSEEERIRKIREDGGKSLAHFRPENISYGMCLAAVVKDAAALKYVPEKFRTAEVFLEACRKDGRLLKSVPKEARSEELCLAAVCSAPAVVDQVPAALLTPAFCAAAVRKQPALIEHLPPALADRELCEIAFAADHRVLPLIPEQFRTEEMYLAAVGERPEMLAEIPEGSRSGAVCREAVSRCGAMLEYVPEGARTPALCRIAVENDAAALAFVPAESAGRELVLQAIRNADSWQSWILKSVPDAVWDRELALAAAGRIKDSLRYIPGRCCDYKLYLAAAKLDDTAARYIPQQEFTTELCEVLMTHGAAAYDWLPQEFVTEDYVAAVAKEAPGKLMFRFPERFRNEAFINRLTALRPDAAGLIRKCADKGWRDFPQRG